MSLTLPASEELIRVLVVSFKDRGAQGATLALESEKRGFCLIRPSKASLLVRDGATDEGVTSVDSLEVTEKD